MAQIPSVSRKLVVSIAVPLVLFFALTVLVLDGTFRNLATQAQRDLLEQELVALVSAADDNPDGTVNVRLLDPESRLATPGSGRYAAVRNTSGVVLWSSPSLLGVKLNFGATVSPGGRQSFVRSLPDGSHATILSRGLQWELSNGRSVELTFDVAESMEPYQRQLWRFRQALVGWFTLLTLLLLVVLGWLLRRALEPVRRLEREIGEMERGEREQLGATYPRELAGVAGNMNALLGSERRRIARYRDTLGNLAHGLKTPLAVMRAALAHDSDARANIDREIDRMVQIVDHQLVRAATGGGATLGQAPVPVAPIAHDLRAAMLKVHAPKDLAIELQVDPAAGFSGDRGDLLELLGNLLDNACKWCRSRVLLQIRIDENRAPTERLVMCLEDDGSGIDPADRSRVLARGARADERAPGHGLGLAMVSDTIALYGGELILGTSSLGGARFEVRLPGRQIVGSP